MHFFYVHWCGTPHYQQRQWRQVSYTLLHSLVALGPRAGLLAGFRLRAMPMRRKVAGAGLAVSHRRTRRAQRDDKDGDGHGHGSSIVIHPSIDRSVSSARLAGPRCPDADADRWPHRHIASRSSATGSSDEHVRRGARELAKLHLAARRTGAPSASGTRGGASCSE